MVSMFKAQTRKENFGTNAKVTHLKTSFSIQLLHPLYPIPPLYLLLQVYHFHLQKVQLHRQHRFRLTIQRINPAEIKVKIQLSQVPNDEIIN